MSVASSRLGQAARAALSEGGDLAGNIPAFAPREAQQDLAVAIANAFDTRGVLLAEAGTGTGKTFAYLVPAILSGQKTIVSTGTRALQDQLYHRDLPRVREALGIGLKTALLKGRSNYLCHYRLEQAKGEGRFANRETAAQFQRIVAWAGRTRMGDLAELETLPDDSPLLPQVTSTADNCLGSECPFFSECFVVQARQRAQAADLVVVNHHLLLADLALKQEGFGEILPGAQAFVVDEAHQLPELAAQFFGDALSARPLVELARDALAECRQVPAALAVLQEPARALEQAVRGLRAAMDDLPVRGTRLRAGEDPVAEAGLDVLLDSLRALHAALLPLRETAPGFDSCTARAREFEMRLLRWRDGSGSSEDAHQVPDADFDPFEQTVPSLPGNERESGEVPADADDRAPLNADDAPSVLWYELTARGFRLSRTPLDVAGPLAQHRARSHAAWVFTSATLAIGGRFEHYAIKLGLREPATLLAPSPFDWAQQALCYLPPGLPEPSARHYTESIVSAIRPVLEASGGRAFVLFASHRALREVAGLLRDGPWPLFVQGEAPRSTLLERFRASGNGVLLGAASFREGVDVAGDTLSVVVIDKLPFGAPDDPVFEARLEAIRRAGGNPFRDEQLPQAVIALKQGAGRLIRSETDRGVLVLCDPRLVAKSYGKVFLDSLPPLPRTRHITDVQDFFRDSQSGEAGSEPAAARETGVLL
ncbi:ATP-dependent DNA helicase [Lysobacter sp. A03]|uniref:ATP-dependent DNA helicase n=1 Tax=Lysobacter sp. A03 TaxID=1199154 RepID=UPI0005B6D773|nr:ATP-dependent DNA helicase [Lysobacter sp. A03]KIQ97899.1 DinG family ATP-dependent helicase YoaA [Lysobacter sp. A03]